jgi:hypothetical protein
MADEGFFRLPPCRAARSGLFEHDCRSPDRRHSDSDQGQDLDHVVTDGTNEAVDPPAVCAMRRHERRYVVGIT